MKKISVLIADDFPIVRHGLKNLIDSQSDMHVVAAAGDGREALALGRHHRPDVILLDLRMPLMNGVETTRALCRVAEKCGVVVLTASGGHEAIHQALAAGARGFLLKTATTAEILDAVRAVAGGKKYLPAGVRAALDGRLSLESLTRRELEVLELIVAGHSNSEIGARLSLREGTIKGHVNRILAKLGVADRTQAALAALSRGIFLWTDAETQKKTAKT